jgi:hypothetical protein
MQRPEYRELFAISQSAIKAFKYKPLQKFKQIYIDKIEDDEDESKFAFGSLVDTLAFEPELIKDRFYISSEDVIIPGEKVKLIVDKVYKEALEIVENKRKLNEQGNLPEPLHIPGIKYLDEFNSLITKYAKEIKYGGTTWSSSRIIDTVYADGAAYFNMLGECGGRTIMTPMDNADAISAVDALRKAKETAAYFVQQKDEVLLFQQEIMINFKSQKGLALPLKAALDIIRISNTDKTVQVADLKTTHNTAGFKGVAKSFDYVTQVSFYNYLIREFLKEFHGGKYQNYTILAPINIVIDKEYLVPFIFQYSEEDIEIAENGSVAHDFKGWRQVLDEIIWHIETSIWDKPKEYYETGLIKLKIFK